MIRKLAFIFALTSLLALAIACGTSGASREVKIAPVGNLTVGLAKGDAELTTDGADAQIDKLAKKYLGEDEYPWRNPAETRVSVRIHPKHVDSYGFDE